MSADIQGTHEWRLVELEKKMERVELRMQYAMYLLVANLLAVLASGVGMLVVFLISRGK